MGINKVILVGNVGKDPEIRHLESGNTVANFTLATNEAYKNKQGEKIESTEWHIIVLWDRLAEVAESYVKKGTQIYIEGKIKTRSYDDKNGVTKYVTEIYGNKMELLGSKQESNSHREEAPPPEESDDLPF